MMKLLRSLFARIFSRRSSPPAGEARSSADGAAPQPDLSAVDLANENASLRARLALVEVKNASLQVQHEEDKARIASLEGVADLCVAAVDELINHFKGAHPTGDHHRLDSQRSSSVVDASAAVRHGPQKAELIPSGVTRTLPPEIIGRIVEVASVEVRNAFAYVSFDYLKISRKEQYREAVVDVRRGHLDSFLARRDVDKSTDRVGDVLMHTQMYGQITLVFGHTDKNRTCDPSLFPPLPVDFGRVQSETLIKVNTLVLNFDLDGDGSPDWLYARTPVGLKNILAQLNAKTLHVYVEYTAGARPYVIGPTIPAIDIPQLAFDRPDLPDRWSEIVFENCLPGSPFWGQGKHDMFGRHHLHWNPVSGVHEVRWSVSPRRIVFARGRAYRGGVADSPNAVVLALFNALYALGVSDDSDGELIRPAQLFAIEFWVTESVLEKFERIIETHRGTRWLKDEGFDVKACLIDNENEPALGGEDKQTFRAGLFKAIDLSID